jgi:hypothetical protein
MPTPKRIAASRANALKSTGPRTAAGKDASRFNALKHGIDAQQQIMYGESAADLAELTAEYHQQHSPANSAERFLVDTLVNNEWRLRRLRRVEADLWAAAAGVLLNQRLDAKRSSVVPPTGIGAAFAASAPTFERLQRIVNSCERSYHRALKELQRLQAVPSDAEPAPVEPIPAAQPEEARTASASVGSFQNNSPSSPEQSSPNPPLEAGLAATPPSMQL